jgi:triacylglycerol esterase/lipase EstA (alpha/beta hydrolase family)
MIEVGVRGPSGSWSVSLLVKLSRLKRQVRYLAGYFDLEPPGPSARAADFDRAERPVLLLNGFMATRRAVEVLERRLRRDGYTVFSFNLGAVQQVIRRGIDDLADHVRTKVERLYERHPGMGPLTIIGHSQGGLVGAWYVKKLGGWRRVRALVTMGTPHRGAPAALAALPLGLLAPAVVQMAPRSRFLRRLASGDWPAGVRLTSIWSRQDLLAPYPSAVVETCGLPQVRNVEVRVDGHRDFLFRRGIYQTVLEDLRDGDVSCPVPLRLLRLPDRPDPGAGPPGERRAG